MCQVHGPLEAVVPQAWVTAHGSHAHKLAQRAGQLPVDARAELGDLGGQGCSAGTLAETCGGSTKRLRPMQAEFNLGGGLSGMLAEARQYRSAQHKITGCDGAKPTVEVLPRAC